MQMLIPFLEDYPRILQLDWPDRDRPPLIPQAWPHLAAHLNGNIMTACQDGHGRSGTAAACLMMCWTDYSPLDAISHLRALHCPQAIESVEQHSYLNELARVLGRPEDANEKVSSYRERFLSMTSEWAKPGQDRLRAEIETARNKD